MEYITEKLTNEEAIGILGVLVGILIGYLFTKTYYKKLIERWYKKK